MITEEWNEGYDASLRKQPKSANPYRSGRDEYYEWNHGYEAHQRTLQRRS